MQNVQMTQARGLREGFSLIEIMIGLLIMGLIMGLAGTTVFSQLKKAKGRTTKLNMLTIKKAIDNYNLDTNKYPDKLINLMKLPADLKGKWEGPYLEGKELPVDGFGEPFKYQRTPEGKKPYELQSYGPNRQGAPKEEWISVWDL
jgi:general secretion pathway protein G